MEKASECYYGCRSEIKQRSRYITSKIDSLRTKIIARKDVLTSDESGEMFDYLTSIDHQLEMMIFAFEVSDKEIERDLERNFKESMANREGF